MSKIRSVFIATVTIPFLAMAAAAFDFEIKSQNLRLISALSENPDLLAFYEKRNFEPVWTGGDADSLTRVQALLAMLRIAPGHGLPYGEADIQHLNALFGQISGPGGREIAEAEMAKFFVRFATAMHSGAVEPASVTKHISRNRQPLAVAELFAGINGLNPAGFLTSLAPDTLQYQQLRKTLKRLDFTIAHGGWGRLVRAQSLSPGEQGEAVVQLRNRLIRMGYLSMSSAIGYSGGLVFAVKRFQKDHGLEPDGIADAKTLAAINVEPVERRKQIIAALERERWLNRPRGEQHIRVNIADFQADVIHGGRSVFNTRVVVGQSAGSLQTPEFSDEMTYVVINPSWNVPRSIATGELLPKLQADATASPELLFIHPETGIVDRNSVDLAKYNSRDFPFQLKQPPGPNNALGQVKFMFPNRFNVYMHDTPLRGLFQRETRSFSHGCIRVHRAQDFAHFLLAQRFEKPGDIWKNTLASGDEKIINLAEPLPVHIIYRTAFIGDSGRVNYRNDIYGRDALVYSALARMSVPSS
ncbi:MAG: L,D-transpeptidase family protein [Rhodobacteraceae bacterium]|nr:L,D-transpeptidase family protein [Paracoccaceae bacterium]